MNPVSFSFEELDRLVRSLVAAETPTDVFKILLEGSRHAAPRASLFLIRQGRIKGWGSVGYGSEPSKLQRNYSTPADAGWLSEVAARDGAVSESGSVSADLDFGQPPTMEALGISVKVLGKPIAILVAELSADEEPWLPALLSMLVQVAQLRLDLDLVRRKLKMAAGTPVIVEQEDAPPQPTAEPAFEAAPAAVDEPAAEHSITSDSGVDDAELDAARRYAKLLATDIRLYNEEAVMLGRQHGDLVERLGEHLDRGKATFLKRHGELGPTALEILHDAYLQVLAGGKDELMPSSVLD
jgi:hypothetical protein